MSESIRNSVIIPYHNGHETICQTLRSITVQGVDNTEIIIVDDRSCDHARSLVEKLAMKTPHIRVVDSRGPGPSAARNTGVSIAQGDLLFFLDADDCMVGNSIERFRSLFDESLQLGVAFGRVRITECPGSGYGIVSAFCPAPTISQILGENPACTTSNYVVRRAAFHEIGLFNEMLHHAEDQEWLARAALHDGKWEIRGLDVITLDYRTTQGGLSSDLAGMADGWHRMVASLNGGVAAEDRLQLAQARGVFYRYLSRRALRVGGERFQPARFILDALTAHPAMIRAEARRTLMTVMAAFLVALFGYKPFQKYLA